MIKFYNAWGPKKQVDKFEITLRLSILTIFEVSYDISDKKFKLVLLNYGISN
jgi:hypothetical protein